MSQEFTCTVEPEIGRDRVRLDQYLSQKLVDVSRTKVQSFIEARCVTVNGNVATSGKTLIKPGDVINCKQMKVAESTDLVPIPMSLDIVFEDDHVLVINKPAGLVVHPGAGVTGATLVHGLLAHVGQLGLSGGGKSISLGEEDEEELPAAQHAEVVRPGIVHRLDKDTSGVMVVAKSDAAHMKLARQFHDKTNFRQYIALLNGVLPDGEWIRESWLYRDPKDRTKFASMDTAKFSQKRDELGFEPSGYRYAKSLFKVERVFDQITLVSVRLFTGRTHQIRIHAKDGQCPVLGDRVYGKGEVSHSKNVSPVALKVLQECPRQMLHAWILGFQHPATDKWMQFEVKPPEDFAHILKNLSQT
jgi:23S rRNA pseudouridine1911/1915/1917 synthase